MCLISVPFNIYYLNMKISIDKIFLVLGIMAFPNLFFRGQYNVPLMLFCFICWNDQFKHFIMYLLIFSWMIDAYLLFEYITKKQDELAYEEGQKSQVVLVISIIIFTIKVHKIYIQAILIAYTILFQPKCRQTLNPSTISLNIKQFFSC